MKLYRYFAVCLMFVIFLTIQACGNSETSGILSMDDLTITELSSGVYSVTSKAVYATSDGKSAEGAVITFTSSATGTTTHQTTLAPSSIKSHLGSNGSADLLLTVNQTDQDQLLQVTASIGGLSVTKIVTIPVLL